MAAKNIQVRMGNGASAHGLTRVSLCRALAYLANRLWVMVVLLGSILFEEYELGIRRELVPDVFFASLAANVVSLIILGFFHNFTEKILANRWTAWVGPGLSGLGVFLIVPDIVMGIVPSTTMIIANSVATGLGSALLLLDIGRSYAYKDCKTGALEILCATAFAAVLSTLLHHTPLRLVLVICIGAPFLSKICLRAHAILHEQGAGVAAGAGAGSAGAAEDTRAKLSVQVCVRLFLAAVILSSLTNFTHGIHGALHEVSMGLQQTPLFLGVVVASVVCVVIVMLFTRSSFLGMLFKVILLFFIVGYIGIPTLGSVANIPFVLIAAGFALFEAFVWISLAAITQKFKISAVQAFGIGNALFQIVSLVTSLVVVPFALSLLRNLQLLNTVGLVIGCAIAIVTVFITLAFIMPDRVFAMLEVDTVERGADEHADAAAMAAAAERKHSYVETALRPRHQVVGEYYNLTPRECEILRLLFRGMGSARIQKELYISAGTVNTHLHRIYQKLGVHSREELVDLVQSANLENLEVELAKRKTE